MKDLKVVAVVFSIFLCVPLVLGGCGSGGDEGSSTVKNDSSTDDGNEITVTSTELIDQALNDGRLDAESALLFKTCAFFDDPRLPAEYKSDTSGIVDPDFLWEAMMDFDSLSPETREALAPFLIPPMYAGSWWDLQNNWNADALKAGIGIPCNPLRSDCPLLTSWKYLAGNNVNVWYQKKYESTDRAKALQVLSVIENQAWPVLTTYMEVTPLPDKGPLISVEGPDSKLDIALVDRIPAKLGTTFPSFALKKCGNASTFILINRTADVGPVAVHELMHSIQYAMPVQECLSLGYKTLMESTANWAVNRIYGRSNQWEHGHIYAYTDNITVSLLKEDPSRRPYGAYLFPLYLTEAEAPDAVKRAWELAETNSQARVFEKLVDLDRVWPEFAARLWNQAPLDEFNQWDGIHKRVKTGMKRYNLDLAGKENEDWVVTTDELPGLSAYIFHISFSDPSIRTAGFFNGFTYKLVYEELRGYGQIVKASELGSEKREDAHLHALVKINDTWENSLRDWTDIPYVFFPLDMSGSKVKELLLVFTNSSADVDHTIKFTGLPSHFWLTNMPWASAWEGSADLRKTDNGITRVFRVTNIRFELMEPVSKSKPFLEINDPGQPYGMISYNLTAGMVSMDISGTRGSCSYSGGGSKPLTTGFMPNQFVLFPFFRDGPATHSYYLGGYDRFPPIEWSVTVTCTDKDGTTTRRDSWDHGVFLIAHLPDMSPALSSDGLRISGTGADLPASEITGTWQLKAVRQAPAGAKRN